MMKLFTKFKEWIEKNSSKPLFTSVIVLLIAIVLILLVDFLISYESLSDFWKGLMVEGHGMFLDVVIVIVIYNWIDNRRQKKNRIERYKEEWIFRSKLNTHSGEIEQVIPEQTEHPIRSKLNTHSGVN